MCKRDEVFSSLLCFDIKLLYGRYPKLVLFFDFGINFVTLANPIFSTSRTNEREDIKVKKNQSTDAFSRDNSEMRKKPDVTGAVPGVNTPDIEVPAYNPPVPNRAWTEMKKDYENCPCPKGEGSKKEKK